MKYELEVELQFQFADDDNRRLAVTQSHDITATNFAFDGEFQTLKKPLHRDVERRFLHAGGIADSWLAGTGSPKGMPLWADLPLVERMEVWDCRLGR